MNGSSSWIEPPPPQRGFGCFGQGCLILVVFVILLGVAFFGGTYYAARYLRMEFFSAEHLNLPASDATLQEEEEVRARWEAFEKAAKAHQSARIELTADDLNALIASEPKLRGDAYVSIDDNTARLQLSFPAGRSRWLRGRYLNAQCSVQSGASRKPRDARIVSIVLNGRPVGDEAVSWKFGSWAPNRFIADWTNDYSLDTFEIADGKVILESKGSGE